MPYRVERPCRAFMCPNTTDNRNGYCDEHQTESKERRGSSRQRGYDKRWEKFRAAYLRERPLCVDCLVKPFPGESPQPATEVHHIRKLRDYPKLKYAEDNLMGLCHRHHSVRTAKGE